MMTSEQVPPASPTVMVGSFPPPVHGQAKNNARIASDLATLTSIKTLNLSPGTLARSSISYHARRILRFLPAFLWMATRNFKAAYISLDSGLGLLYQIPLVLCARIRKRPTTLHHRSFSYVNTRSGLMGALLRITEHQACHVFLCETHSRQFQDLYGRVNNIIVDNVRLLDVPPNRRVLAAPNTRVVGYLSNASLEKGIDTFISLAQRMRSPEYSFVVAGPTEDLAVREAIERAAAEGVLTYIGPVYGEAKMAYLDHIDILCFPTRYAREAQPNVLFEAMARDCLVMTTARGCIAEDIPSPPNLISSSAGQLLADAPDFLKASEAISRSGNADSVSDRQSLSHARYRALMTRLAEPETVRGTR
ncbi:glycosyltransferase [Nitriliruptoraceae bacterium ZYF776]|nr:glycosyltransferase [Profundirhabdus halotolerans]